MNDLDRAAVKRGHRLATALLQEDVDAGAAHVRTVATAAFGAAVHAVIIVLGAAGRQLLIDTIAGATPPDDQAEMAALIKILAAAAEIEPTDFAAHLDQTLATFGLLTPAAASPTVDV